MAGTPGNECPDLTTAAAQNTLLLSSDERAVGTAVNVTCSIQGHSLVGESQLTCLATKVWSSDLPSCAGDDGLSEREKIVIGLSSAVVFVIVVALVVVVVCYYRARAKTKQKRNERLAATLERLSIRDPLDELVRRESRRSSILNPAFNSSSVGDTETDRRYTLDARQSPWKLYKIWDYTRTKKQFVFAEGLDELVVKGGEKLRLSGPIRVVLEEDGTEIDNDAVLRACAGMVFLLLEHDQVWSKPEVVLSVHEYSNNLNHYRYDVDEKL